MSSAVPGIDRARSPLAVRHNLRFSRQETYRPWIHLVAGLLIALVMGEASIRAIGTPRGGVRTAVGAEIRSFGEGMAASHFLDTGERLTGNPVLPRSDSIVLLGNSFVEALQVPDGSTMGAVLERIARAANHPLNVHQYGWSGESLAQYLRLAGFINGMNASRVVVLVHKYDLCATPLSPSPKGLSVSIGPDLSVTIHAGNLADSGAHRVLRGAMDHSALLTALVRRSTEMMETPGGSGMPPCDGRLPAATVKSLKGAYGSKLLLAYIADVGIPADPRPDRFESALFEACRAENVGCISSRSGMVEAYEKSFAVARGFHNTKIGVGHLNETGHRVMAAQLWKALFASN